MQEIIPINNLTFIFSPLDNIETASLGIFLRVGSRFEQRSLKGIAHFLEHMVFKGTKQYSHRKIKQEIEGRGGLLNAFTSQELTAYHANFLKKNFKKTLDILIDMVQEPLLKVQEINKERKVILEEIKMYNDLPSCRAGTLLENLLWKGHALGEDVIGTKATVNNIGQSDLKSFRKQYYVPSNTVIALSGAFSKKEVLKPIQERVRSSQIKVSLASAKPSPLSQVRIAIEEKDYQQSHLYVGFRAVPWQSEKRLSLRLIDVILGANMSSRLFEELREKKSLCYEISSEARFYKDSGGFLIHLGLDASKIELALTTILKQLDKLKQKQVSAKELSRAKDYLLGQIAMGLEVPQGRMWYSAHNYINLGKIYTFLELKQIIQSITPGQIRRLAREIFNFERICVSCVGRLKEELRVRIAKIIKSGGSY